MVDMVDALEELNRIVMDREMGSTQIAFAVLRKTAELVRGMSGEELEAALAKVMEVAHRRSSMPVIANALREMRRLLAEGMDAERAAESVIAGIGERIDESVTRLVGHLGKGVRVATYSYSSHALRAIRELEPELVELPFCSPLNEGIRASAELRRAGVRCSVSQDLEFLRRLRGCDAVLLGSDAVLRDGRIANRSGTSSLIERASELGLQCLFLTDPLKLDLKGLWRNETIELEGVTFELFDLTEPLENVLTVSSFGVLRPEEFAERASAFLIGSSSR